MDILFFILYIISLVIMADSKLKEFPAGKQFLIGLENGTINILRWRAYADAKADMIKINKVLLVSTLILFACDIVLVVNKIQLNIFFGWITIINFLLFASIQWFIDFKKQVTNIAAYAIILFFTPWIFHFLGRSVGFKDILVEVFSNKLLELGISPISDYSVLALLSVILLLGCFVFFILEFVLLSIPSILLFSAIKIINKASNVLIKTNRQKVHLFFVGVNILAPIWFFAKDRIA